MVKPDDAGRTPLVGKALQHLFDLGEHLGLDRLVHERLRGRPDQTPAFTQDVECDTDGDQGVQPQPSGEVHGDQSHKHPRRSPDVGHQVPGVAAQSHRAVFVGGPEHDPSQHTVERRTHHRQAQPQPQLVQGLRIKEAVRRRPDDAQGGADDQNPLEPGRKIFGLVVPVGVGLIGRARRHHHHGQTKHRARQVDARLQGVGQQADRVRHPPGAGFEGDGEQGHRDRGLHQPLGGPQLEPSGHRGSPINSGERAQIFVCPPATRTGQRPISTLCR